MVLSPDGSTLSVLFDNVAVTGGRAGQTARAACDLQIPLALPDGFSLGVYKVDYRGFARLQPRQIADLDIDYGFGTSGRFKFFHRLIAGAMEDDCTYSATIGGGLMARAGCGAKAMLTLHAALTLQSPRQRGETVVSLDSVDGARVGGVVFHLDRKKCQTLKLR